MKNTCQFTKSLNTFFEKGSNMENVPSTESKLVMPPSLSAGGAAAPGLSVIMNDDAFGHEKILHIYSQIINSSRVMYRNLLRHLYSADLIEITDTQNIEGADGKSHEIRTPVPKIQKLPSSNKICPRCRKLYVEEIDTCSACVDAAGNKNVIQLEYLNWRPLLNDNGFNQVASIVLSCTDEIMSTGNINAQMKNSVSMKINERLDLTNMAVETTNSILRTITENIYEWSATGKPNITKGQYLTLADVICDHIYWVYSRSIEAFMVESIKDSTKFSIGAPAPSRIDSPRVEKPKSLSEIFFGRNES